MAVAVRGKASIDTTTLTTQSTLTLSLNTLTDETGAAAAAQAGDLAIFTGVRNGTVTLSLNRTGYTATTQPQVATTYTGGSWYKVLTATDITNNTVTMSAGSTGRMAFGVLVLSGVNGTTPLDVVTPNPTEETQATGANEDTTLPFPTINPTDEAFMCVMGSSNVTAGVTGLTAPATWTELFDEVTSNGSGRRVGVFGMRYNSNPTAAMVLGGNMTVGGGGTAYGSAWTFAVRPYVPPPASDPYYAEWNGTAFVPLEIHEWNGSAFVALTPSITT